MARLSKKNINKNKKNIKKLSKRIKGGAPVKPMCGFCKNELKTSRGWFFSTNDFKIGDAGSKKYNCIYCSHCGAVLGAHAVVNVNN